MKKKLNNRKKEIIIAMIVISVIAIMVCSININQPCQYFRLSFMEGMTLIIALVFAFFLIDRGYDRRHKDDYCVGLIKKIQKNLENNYIMSPKIGERKMTLLMITTIQNDIDILKDLIGKKRETEVEKIKEKFNEYDNVYGDICDNAEKLNLGEDMLVRLSFKTSDLLETLASYLYQ